MTQPVTLLHHVPSSTPSAASLTVQAARRASHTVNPWLYGKFCEHLGSNIYHGMEAQILFNCTFAKWRFSAGDNHPDGGVREESDFAEIRERMPVYARRFGWPDLKPIADAYFAGGAFGWFAIVSDEEVRLSPDVGPYGARAQRVEIQQVGPEDPHGIGQWTYLPLHRTRSYEYRMVIRAVAPCELIFSLTPAEASTPATQVKIQLQGGWQTITGTLQVPEDAPADAIYLAALTTETPAHIVFDRVLLYPGDHVNHADPDIIHMLKSAGLPLLRWPGGNFVSGYHWFDGVGPVDARPTLPNPAWEGLEFNLFGTDEFIAFCRAVGCEPMICVNAGSGTPEEAAAWVEYCNGSPDTPMGELRAAHGHPEPYNVTMWEIGNEIYGHWQVSWTTPDGNADRYQRFREAMLAVDPSVKLLGCGYGNEPLSEWNQRLIEEAGDSLRSITDHILTGGTVNAETNPVELYHAFMGYPTVLTQRYQALEAMMEAAGIENPHLGITELQLFAHFHGDSPPDARLTPTMVPRPDTIAEALSLTAIANMGIRLGDFVELLTHSATVNHGGGLRKEHERVYANPVHYAHAMGQVITGGTPVAVELACATFGTDTTFVHIPPLEDVPILDAMAVLKEGNLVVVLVHRGGDHGPVQLNVALEGFEAASQAEGVTLTGETWHDRNTLEAPTKITPQPIRVTLTDAQHLTLTLQPFSVIQVTLKPRV